MKRVTAVAATFVTLAGLGGLLPLHSDAFAPDAELTSDETCDKGPLSRPRANCAPPSLPSTDNLNDDCVARINQLRWECQCLPPLTRWKGGEQCANKHAKYDSKRGIHGGFNKGICKPEGLAQNECPGWPSKSGVIEGMPASHVGRRARQAIFEARPLHQHEQPELRTRRMRLCQER